VITTEITERHRENHLSLLSVISVVAIPPDSGKTVKMLPGCKAKRGSAASQRIPFDILF
jgi:hypothetical protein